jgi:hypothetical protein
MVLHLTQNMPLNVGLDKECAFAQWQLNIVHGHCTATDGTIELPPTIQLPENSPSALINYIYPEIDQHPLPDSQDFSNHAILSSQNSNVDKINQDILNCFSEEESTFHDTLLNNNLLYKLVLNPQISELTLKLSAYEALGLLNLY